MLTEKDVRRWRAAKVKDEKDARIKRVEAIRKDNGGSLENLKGDAADEVREALDEIQIIRTHGVAKDMIHPTAPGSGGSGAKDDKAALSKGESMEEWVKSNGVRQDDQGLNLGRYVKGIATGQWASADAERKAMSEGVLADGGHMVPEPLSAQVIDLARNRARVMQAGAMTIPMTSSSLKVARQIGDASGTWHAENVADITESELQFDAVTLQSRTLTALVKFSRELFEDVPAPGLDARVRGSIAEALALELDSKALYGDNATNPQEPTGLRNTSGITVQTFAAPDGGTPEDYEFLLDAYFELENVNFEPGASILNPRDERTIAGFADTTGQPLRPPDAVAEVRRLRTNQVRIDETVGLNSDTSSVFVGSWPELLIGMRTQLQIQFLTERYAESGTLALLAWMRADVAVAREDAFVIIEGLRAAAA